MSRYPVSLPLYPIPCVILPCVTAALPSVTAVSHCVTAALPCVTAALLCVTAPLPYTLCHVTLCHCCFAFCHSCVTLCHCCFTLSHLLPYPIPSSSTDIRKRSVFSSPLSTGTTAQRKLKPLPSFALFHTWLPQFIYRKKKKFLLLFCLVFNVFASLWCD